jgi:hypothetical protein
MSKPTIQAAIAEWRAADTALWSATAEGFVEARDRFCVASDEVVRCCDRTDPDRLVVDDYKETLLAVLDEMAGEHPSFDEFRRRLGVRVNAARRRCLGALGRLMEELGRRRSPASAGAVQKSKPRITVGRADEIMREAVETDSADLDIELLKKMMAWGSREWAEYVARENGSSCTNSTIAATPQFKKLAKTRETARINAKKRRAEAREKPRPCGGGKMKPRHYSKYDGKPRHHD